MGCGRQPEDLERGRCWQRAGGRRHHRDVARHPGEPERLPFGRQAEGQRCGNGGGERCRRRFDSGRFRDGFGDGAAGRFLR